MMVVVSAILGLSEAAEKTAPKEEERAQAIRDGQQGLHEMTKELRRAHVVHSVADQTIEVNVLAGGVDTRVRYQCDVAHPTESSYRRCYRYVVAGDGSTSGDRLVIDRVLNAGLTPAKAVFARTGSYVTATVDVSARGDRHAGYGYRIALHDAFYARNLDG